MTMKQKLCANHVPIQSINFGMNTFSTLKSANQSSKNGHVALLIGQFQRRVKFYSEILFKGLVLHQSYSYKG